MDSAGNTVSFLFGDTIDCQAVFDQIKHPSTSKYIGDAYTDLVFALDKFAESTSESDSVRNTLSMSISDGLRDLVFNGDASTFSSEYSIYGSADIELQEPEGAIGLKLEGVHNFKIQQSSIHNVENWGLRGSTLPSDTDYEYTGNRAKGFTVDSSEGIMDNLEIFDIDSHSGSAHGGIMHEGCSVGVTNVRIRNVQAGSYMTQSNVNQLTMPNSIPLGCSLEISGDAEVYSTVGRDDLGDFTGHFIIGYDLCSDAEDAEHAMRGQCEWCYNRNSNGDLSQNGGPDLHLMENQHHC